MACVPTEKTLLYLVTEERRGGGEGEGDRRAIYTP